MASLMVQPSLTSTLVTPVSMSPITTVARSSGHCPGSGSPSSSTTVNSTKPSAVLPATSVARKSTTWSPTSDTLTGDSYGPNSPPSRLYSTDSTPEPSSVALIATSAEPT